MPSTGRFLLDTNIVIAVFEGDDGVLSNLEGAAEVFVPAIVIGELLFGAAKSSRPAENVAKVEQFASASAILACDLEVAREYGRVKKQLRDIGQPIPENDIWIAATAKHHVATRDRHFLQVDGLATGNW